MPLDLCNIKDFVDHSMLLFVETTCFRQSRTVVAGQNLGDCGVLYVYLSVEKIRIGYLFESYKVVTGCIFSKYHLFELVCRHSFLSSVITL